MVLRAAKIQPKSEVQKGTKHVPHWHIKYIGTTYLSDVNTCRFKHSFKEVDHAMTLAIPESQLQELKLAAAHDPVLLSSQQDHSTGLARLSVHTSQSGPLLPWCAWWAHGPRWTGIQKNPNCYTKLTAKTNDEICPQITHWHRRLCTQS